MILAIDQGTTGTTCIVFDRDGEQLGRAYSEFKQYFPQPGWVEHDPLEIWQCTHAVAGAALAEAGVKPGELEAIGITNQRETVVAWDSTTGRPLHRALVWQDRRTAEVCQRLTDAGYQQQVRESTGLTLDPYFTATKIQWLLQNVPEITKLAAEDRIVFGTVDSWLIYKLTGEVLTDPSNASRTLLYNLKAKDWDQELLDLFSIKRSWLPQITASIGYFGETDPTEFHGQRAPITGVAGDQQAALFGHGCLNSGETKTTYGTGSFVLMNTGTEIPLYDGLLTTAAWQIGDNYSYALEAPVFVTGAAIQWLRDGLGIIKTAAETEQLAASLKSNDGVYFVPALTGLGSPHWDPYARGSLFGLTRGTTRAHIARAALEAIAYQNYDALTAMEQASGRQVQQLWVDGGATKNAWLMQFQADLLGREVFVPEQAEITALGAAKLAGVGAGLMTLTQIRQERSWRASYSPQITDQQRQQLLSDWNRAVERSRRWQQPTQ